MNRSEAVNPHLARLRRQNGEDIGVKRVPQIVVLPARPFRFEIEAILASFGFDRLPPLLRWHALRYRHIPAARRLALKAIASNLSLAKCGFTA